MGDIYIVRDGSRVIGVSARLQGAELLRAAEARRLGSMNPTDPKGWERFYYERIVIENHELQDGE
jgi:hypothetical protein